MNSAEHYLEALKAARGQSSAKACAKNRPAPGTKGALGLGHRLEAFFRFGWADWRSSSWLLRGVQDRGTAATTETGALSLTSADAMTHGIHGSIGVKMAVGKVWKSLLRSVRNLHIFCLGSLKLDDI